MRQHLVNLVKLEYVIEFLQYKGKETSDTKYIVKTQFRLSVSARHRICNFSVTFSAIYVYVYESQKTLKKKRKCLKDAIGVWTGPNDY